jgi:hypothetical protein
VIGPLVGLVLGTYLVVALWRFVLGLAGGW